jgi:hypothetical protein
MPIAEALIKRLISDNSVFISCHKQDACKEIVIFIKDKYFYRYLCLSYRMGTTLAQANITFATKHKNR